jgi:putative tryptophan/tyrosine transport system substrate-binding protein
MRRREFITLLGGTAAAWPLAAGAQQPVRMRLVGMLVAYAESDPEAEARVAAFRQGLRELGWTDDHNLRIELRWGTGDPVRAQTFATELISLAPDVIVAHGTPALAALHRATRTIPIVFVSVIDPVGAGYVQSFALPGGSTPRLNQMAKSARKTTSPNIVNRTVPRRPRTSSGSPILPTSPLRRASSTWRQSLMLGHAA